MKEVKISEVIKLIKEGYTRWQKEEILPEKSIQRHYNLTFTEGKALFAHPKLKGIKTKVPSMVVIDDTEAPSEEPSPSPVSIIPTRGTIHASEVRGMVIHNEQGIPQDEMGGSSAEIEGAKIEEPIILSDIEDVEAPRTVEETWFSPAEQAEVAEEVAEELPATMQEAWDSLKEELAKVEVPVKASRAKRKKAEPNAEVDTVNLEDATGVRTQEINDAIDATAPVVPDPTTAVPNLWPQEIQQLHVEEPETAELDRSAMLEAYDEQVDERNARLYGLSLEFYRNIKAGRRCRDRSLNLVNPLTGEVIERGRHYTIGMAYDALIESLRQGGLVPMRDNDPRNNTIQVYPPVPTSIDPYQEARYREVQAANSAISSSTNIPTTVTAATPAPAVDPGQFTLAYIRSHMDDGETLLDAFHRLRNAEAIPVAPVPVPVDPIDDEMSRKAAELMARMGAVDPVPVPARDSTDKDINDFGDEADSDWTIITDDDDYDEDVYDYIEDEYVSQDEFNHRQEQRRLEQERLNQIAIAKAKEDEERQRLDEATISVDLKKINAESEDIMDLFK